jgi:hypothetical protein
MEPILKPLRDVYILYNIDSMAIVIAFQQVIANAEDEVAHNVERQITAPVGHVQWLASVYQEAVDVFN